MIFIILSLLLEDLPFYKLITEARSELSASVVHCWGFFHLYPKKVKFNVKVEITVMYVMEETNTVKLP